MCNGEVKSRMFGLGPEFRSHALKARSILIDNKAKVSVMRRRIQNNFRIFTIG